VLRVQHYMARRDPTMYMREQWPRSALTESRGPIKSHPESGSTRRDLSKIYSETAHPVSLLQPEMQRMKLRNHESVTATLSRLLTKI
jgi:hypothetical protein